MTTTRRTLILLVLVPFGAAAGQDRALRPEQFLPEGMVLDSGGKLQWDRSEPKPCSHCEGAKTLPCRCVEAPERCGECEDGRTRCRTCVGAGREIDPYLSARCPVCYAKGDTRCNTCAGRKIVYTVGGEETACRRCDAKGSNPCPLCAGARLIPAIRAKGTDLRYATAEQLGALDDALRKYLELDEGWKNHAGAEDRLARTRELVDRFAPFAVLPGGQAERLERLNAVDPADEESDEQARSALARYVSGLRELATDARRRIITCRWKLRRAAADPATVPPRKASALQWQEWFGTDPKEPGVTCTLLGAGYLLADSAPGTGEVIRKWLSAHPAALAREVVSVGPSSRGEHLKYVWIEDGSECLNVELVRRGCVAAGAMRSFVPEIDIAFAPYFDFLTRVDAAEKEARAAKLGVWRVAARDSESHEQSGGALKAEGKYEEAIAAYRAALARPGGGAHLWVEIGECYERLERPDEALAAYDQAIGEGGWSPPYVRKAHCLQRTKGVDAAVAWLKSLEKSEDDARGVAYMLGSFHEESGRDAEAIPCYERSFAAAIKEQGFRFGDDDMLVLDEATLAKENNDFAALWPSLEDLARCCLRARDVDKAYRYATMGVSIGQQMNRFHRYLKKPEVEAGSVPCRLVRARVHLLRGELDESARELNYAKALADPNGYKGWVDEIREIGAALERKRAK